MKILFNLIFLVGGLFRFAIGKAQNHTAMPFAADFIASIFNPEKMGKRGFTVLNANGRKHYSEQSDVLHTTFFSEVNDSSNKDSFEEGFAIYANNSLVSFINLNCCSIRINGEVVTAN